MDYFMTICFPRGKGVSSLTSGAVWVRNGSRKWLHRRVCQSYLPPRILKRKKRGFASNIVDEWFRSSLKGELSELLLDESSLMFELLKPDPVRKLLDTHRSRRQDNHK